MPDGAMDRALLKIKEDLVGSNKLPKQGKDVFNTTLHSEDPHPIVTQDTEVL